MEAEPKRVRRQPMVLEEKSKDWHGVWSEITLTPRGANIGDLALFENTAKARVRQLLLERFRKHGPLKLVGYLELAMTSPTSTSRLHGFSTGSKKRDTGRPLLREDDVAKAADELFETLNNRVEEYEARGSGWQIGNVNFFTLKMTPYRAALGRGWLDLPEWVRAKKAVINIKNSDDRCFAFAWTLATHLDVVTAHRDRPSNYLPYLSAFKMVGKYPVSARALPAIEAANERGVNVFGLDLETAKGPSDIILEYKATHGAPINMLRAFRGKESHYCYIANLDGLLREGNTDKNICSTCLQCFSDPAVLAEHARLGKCEETADEAMRELPPAEKALVRFTQIEKQLRVPFGIYLAMEVAEQGEHHATRVCVKAVSDYPAKFGANYKEFEGERCIPDFLEWLAKRESYALGLLKTNVPMNLTPAEEAHFQAATQCYLCEEPLAAPPNRHRDHDHLSGAFRGAACPGCNVNLHHKRFQLPVFCHGLREREAHLLMQHMDSGARELRCLPQSVEKMLSITWGRCRFVDTRAFLDAELPALVASLRASNPAALAIADVQATASPAKAAALQLLCVFEAFRAQAQRDVGLDPAHFVGVPGLAWTACLRKTKARIGCFSEGQEDMLAFVQRAIRGGVSAIRKRYARANNPTVAGYDPSKPTSWLQLLDCTSLYPAAMMDKLPIGEFKWVQFLNEDEEFYVSPSEWLDTQVADYDKGSATGYFLEVDVAYPAELHDAHNDLPLLPEHRIFAPSPTMASMASQLGLAPATLPKLVPNLCDKERIVVHVRELAQAMRLGLRVSKVHRVLQFRQEAFLKPWIEQCVAQRRAAANDFERDFWKLMMNSVFGKTCEQVQGRVDVKFVCGDNAERLEHLTSRPQFKDATVIAPNLLAVELGKCRVKYDKPIAVGAAILGISKEILADFWYGCIREKYPGAELCMTDTDSLLLHVETPDLYGNMAGDTRYDTSNFPREHPLFCADRAKLPGFFKDETGGRPIAEFVGLRSKMYSLEMADGGPAKKTAGGILLSAAEKLSHDQYRAALHSTTLHKVEFDLVQSAAHVLSTHHVERVGLCPYDTKCFVLEDGITTMAHGHYRTL